MGRKKNELDLIFSLGKGIVKTIRAAEKASDRRRRELEREERARKNLREKIQR
jgi:hypothetical protein